VEVWILFCRDTFRGQPYDNILSVHSTLAGAQAEKERIKKERYPGDPEVQYFTEHWDVTPETKKGN